MARGRYRDETARRVKEINKTRAYFGMPLIEMEERPCLKCKKNFESRSKENRLCNSCRVMEDQE